MLPDPPQQPELPEPLEPRLQVTEDADNPLPETDIAKLASTSPLPKWVQVQEDFTVEDSSVTLKKGDECLLHYVVEEVQRIHAMDIAAKNELWLPVYHEQTYLRLPLGKYPKIML